MSAGAYLFVSQAMSTALGALATLASQPQPRVAQHWESTARLTWFGAAADHHLVHVSWSFGRLKGVAEPSGPRPTVGVFSLTPGIFPQVDAQPLRRALDALVPADVDGATRVFLMRVAAQFAAADALLSLERAVADEVSLFARPDAVQTDAPTPRWPEHARERVAAALLRMDDGFRARCEATFPSPEPSLLAALRAR